MAAFRVRVFEENGQWFFRWDNMQAASACGVSSPMSTREAAESERQLFMENERKKRPWVMFETE